jgi:bifunctional DNA-binding transcriptional regulator/antitoxin component of YhaV-PrlF toxin-antitoxin module
MLRRISVDDVVDAQRCVIDERGRIYLSDGLRQHLGATKGETVLALKGEEGEILLLSKRTLKKTLTQRR